VTALKDDDNPEQGEDQDQHYADEHDPEDDAREKAAPAATPVKPSAPAMIAMTTRTMSSQSIVPPAGVAAC
jgi:hypothetical protein